MLEDCLFTTLAREHPHPLGALEGSLKGPSLWHFNPPSFNLETSQFLESSSGSGRAHSSSAAPSPQGMREGAEMLEGKHSRDALLFPSLVTLAKSLSFPDF